MKKRLLALLLVAVMLLSLVPMTVFATGTSRAITNGTPEGDAAKNHGYIVIDKAAAAKGETVTITVKPNEGYQLKSLTVTPVATFKAVYDTTGEANTLTFYYDGVDHSGEGITVYEGSTGDNYLFDNAKSYGKKWGYDSNRGSVKSVIIDSSVADYKGLTSTTCMFQNMSIATNISGAEYLDVSNVTDMSFMFNGFGGGKSGSPTTLNVVPDVSKWNTGNVTNMYGMFESYGNFSSSLDKVPDVSGWNTEKVTDMTMMFQKYGHESQNFNAVPDVSKWNTDNVTSMKQMFNEYGHKSTALGTVPDVSGWNTGNVTNMYGMFNGYGSKSTNISCVLDLSGWDLSKITGTNGVNVFNFKPKTFDVKIPAKTGEKSNKGDKWYYGDGTNFIAPPEGKSFTPPAPTEYTVTFDLNGITGTAPTAQKIEDGEKVTKPADPTDTVHTFAGWYKTKNVSTGALSDPWDFNNGTVTANMTLYAQWTRTLESIYTGSDIPKVTNNSAPDDAWENGDGGKAFIAYSTGNTVLYFYKKLEPAGAKQISCKKTENFTKIGDDYVFSYGTQYGVFTLHMTEGKLTSVTYDGAGTDYAELSGTYFAPVKYMVWDETNKQLVEKKTINFEEVKTFKGSNLLFDTLTLKAGKIYVVKGSDIKRGTIRVEGTIDNPTTLIICDGAKLTASFINVESGKALVITGQSGCTGELVVNASIGSTKDAGNITINGGKITATCSSNTAAIGGGLNSNGGTITINGGVVNANGEDGAGIGGGKDGNGGTVTINGGTVTASNDGSGAGIGGGWNGNGGIVTINGGKITATGGDSSAGIGGGQNGNGGTVTINGGEVTATGGADSSGVILLYGAAGIGGGYAGNGGTVTINGGKVTATGGKSAAGIGGGEKGNGGTVIINGGNVTATAGESAEAIGKGKNGSTSGTVTFKEGVNFTINAGDYEDDTSSKTTAEYAEDHSAAYVSIEGASATPLPAGALKGVFTVSDPDGIPNSGDEKKVHFSQGNLYWDGDSFELETNQYDFQSSWSTSHVSHFFWSKTASVTYAQSYSDGSSNGSDVFFTNATAETAKSDFTVNGVTGQYRTLSKDEWVYLINKSGNENIRKDKYKYGVTVCEKTNCLILAPDDFTGTIEASYDATAWATAEAAGLVCLPAAGSRSGSRVSGVGDSDYYWSSTAKDEEKAYCVQSMYGRYVTPDNPGNRIYGFSVRLVTEVKAGDNSASAPKLLKSSAPKLLKSSAPKQLKSSAPKTAPATITPEKQQDGKYTFTMPGYAVIVTAEFEVAPPTYTKYENWQIKYGNSWEWSDNMEKVGDGLFKIEIYWQGTGINVKSDENPIKKDWFAPEELILGEEVFAPVTIDVYLRVIDDETVKIGVGVDPDPPHTHTGTKQNGQPATETAAGWSDYYKCDCGLYFEDKDCTVEIGDETALAAWKTGDGAIAKLVHTITSVSAQAATQTEPGFKAYYECKNCGKYYEDAEGKNEITDLSAWKAKGGNGYIPSGDEIDAAKTAAKAALDAENAKDPLIAETVLTNGKSAIDSAETLADIENAKNAAITAIQQAQATELAGAKKAAKDALDTEEAKDPLTDKAALTNGKNNIDGATTKAAVEEAKNNAITAIQEAQAGELATAKTDAKNALDTENAKDPLINETALTDGKSNIDNAGTKAAVEEAKNNAITAIQEAQAGELANAKDAAKSALDTEEAKDPLTDKTALTNGKDNIDGATTKAAVEEAKNNAITAIQEAQAGELADAKDAAKAALDTEEAKDPLTDKTALTNGKDSIDGATTKAAVEEAKNAALTAIQEAQAGELADAKDAAKAALDAEEAKDPLTDKDALTNGKDNIDEATTKAAVEAAKNAAVTAIQEAQAGELADAKDAAKAALDTEEAKDPLTDKTALTNGKDNIDGATTKAAVEEAKNAAITAIQEAQAGELANAKDAAKAALDAEEAKDPLTDKTALTNGKNSIDGATTKAAVEEAKNAAITAIQEAQAGELADAKDAAKAALDTEEAKDPLTDKTALTNGKDSIDGATTKAAVEEAKNAAITAIQEAQAGELADAKDAAKAALETEEAKDPLTDKTALTNGKDSIDEATTKAAVEAAKNAAITAIQEAQATEHKDPKDPKPGDASKMTLWMILALFASAGIYACLEFGGRRKAR